MSKNHILASNHSSSANSFNTSNYSAAADDTDHTENLFWNQALLGAGNCNEAMQGSGYDDSEKILEALSGKNNQLFNPAYDYFKKEDNSWDLANHFEEQLNEFNEEEMFDSAKMTANLSDLNYINGDHRGALSIGSSCLESQLALNSRVIGLSNSGLISDLPWSIPRNFSNLLNNHGMELSGCDNISGKGFVSSESSKKTGNEASSSTKESGRSSGIRSDGKKKRADQYSSVTIFKKSKHENSSSSNIKMQVAKVKVGEKITTLQQLVSPFGKTDTASVLLEAINYIRFLQEQIQDHSSWRSMERKEKVDQKLDLRSRGLCLMPISCAPQVYKENTGPEYWTPTYRGCFYR